MTINFNGITVKSVKGQDPPVNDANHVYSYKCDNPGSSILNSGTGANGNLAVYTENFPSVGDYSFRLSRAQLSTHFKRGEWAKSGTAASIIPSLDNSDVNSYPGVTIEAFVIPNGMVDNAEATLISIDNGSQSLSICTDGTDWYGKASKLSLGGAGGEITTENYYTDSSHSVYDNTYQKKVRWGVPTHLILTYSNLTSHASLDLWIDGTKVLVNSSVDVSLNTLNRISLAGDALMSNKFFDCYVSQARVSNIKRSAYYCNYTATRCFGM